MGTSDTLNRWAFSNYFNERLSFIAFLVDVSNVTGGVGPFQGDRNGVMNALKPDCYVRNERNFML